ncbi:MAG: transglutaminaseTgpA domain-containing protein [Pseudomonadota bacterium]|nr:transglutaminaseTgpA domain-containing protein [Pseudomonadota bacterium]
MFAASDSPRALAVPSKALLWLIAAFAVLLVPQWDRLPVWLVAACVILAGWRWLAQGGRVRLPGRWLRIGIMLVLMGVYVATVQGRFTVDTAASFFVLAVGLKWLETRDSRDFYVLFFILVYLATVNFLFRQDILWALVNFFGIALLLIGLQALNGESLPEKAQNGWKRLGMMMLKTLPVVILLFVFFPRMAPLWSVPMVSGQARTGLSDTMTPGDISSLAQSSERAFRVTFGDEPPPYAQRYWRGLILDYLEGETWRQRDSGGFQRPGRVAIDGGVGPLENGQYDVLLEPTDQTWAFALEGSVAVSDNVTEAEQNLFRFRRPADTSVRYRMALDESPAATVETLSAAEQRRFLQLPVGGNPRTRQLANDMAATLTPEQIVVELMRRFREQAYFYTLRPPAMPDDGIDALMFDEKRGFCAHYAGATTFLLRAAGIPARIVAGYQGGEAGAGGEYLIVRQYDAHAWVEVWLEGRGWVRVDPTAAIAPSRIESGLREAMAEEGSFLEDNLLSPQRYGDVALVQWASMQLDRINYHWQRWVVGYQGQSQMDLMSRLPGGIGMTELGYLTAGLVGLALGIAGLVSGLKLRRADRRDPLRRLVSAWHRLAEQAGVPVRAGETPDQLADRLVVAMPEVENSVRRFAQGVNNHYYKRPSGQDAERTLRHLRRLLKTMKRRGRPAPGTAYKGFRA